VIGLVAIASGGGSGTFASFNAEVANNGNTFASGTLYLHDTNGSTTCASESSTSNSNLGTPFTANNGCAVLFSTTLPTGHTTLSTALTNGGATSTLTVAAIVGGGIQSGDEILLNDGSGHTQTFFATAAASTGATSISVSTQNANFAYPSGTTTVTDDARFTRLQLTNAGSLDASGIKFSLGNPGGCVDSTATTTTANLSGLHNVGSTVLTLSAPLTNGVPSGTVITIAAPNSETVTTSASANPGATTLAVSATTQSHATNTQISWGLSFTGGTALCGSLPIVVVETNSTYGHDTGTAALGCAYGTSLANYGCSFGANKISTIGTSLTSLTLASGGSGNTGTQLNSNSSRYFVIGVQTPASLTNGSQNEQAKFDLVWHIDQA
jgi:hypothetical protein